MINFKLGKFDSHFHDIFMSKNENTTLLELSLIPFFRGIYFLAPPIYMYIFVKLYILIIYFVNGGGRIFQND